MIQVLIHDDDRRYAVEVLKTTNFGHRSRGFNGNYAKQYANNKENAIRKYVECSHYAKKIDIGLNAGHDLSQENLKYL